MNNREIKIGNNSYKNKTEALKCYKKILDKYNSGTSVDDNDMDLLIDLINYDPESVNFEMEEPEEDLETLIIHDIYVDFHPVYKKTKCFFADLGDEQWLFSYRLMINGDLSEDKKFNIACRNAVKNDLHKFKEKVFANKPVKCAISNIEVDWDTCQIDHKPPLTFSVIVRSFIDARKIEVIYPLSVFHESTTLPTIPCAPTIQAKQ